jgi:hypothetical protein
MWTAEQLFDFYAVSPHAGRNRVHWQRHVPFAGQPGHYYFFAGLDRPLSAVHMAGITRRSHYPEVVLLLLNTTYVVYIGNRGVANAVFFIPPRSPDMSVFRWISHTHPLEMESSEQGIARGPTNQDFDTLKRLHRTWGQEESTVIVCRRGHVEREVLFHPEPEPVDPFHVWTPSLD